ncbi:hypothetical protein [Laspinema palackyanum]
MVQHLEAIAHFNAIASVVLPVQWVLYPCLFLGTGPKPGFYSDRR